MQNPRFAIPSSTGVICAITHPYHPALVQGSSITPPVDAVLVRETFGPGFQRRPHEATSPAHPAQKAGALRPVSTPDPPALRPLAQQARADPSPCLLCGAAATAIGAFVPLDPPQWGVQAGWMAGRVYTLCRACAAEPSFRQRVEQTLWAERAVLARRAAAPWN